MKAFTTHTGQIWRCDRYCSRYGVIKRYRGVKFEHTPPILSIYKGLKAVFFKKSPFLLKKTLKNAQNSSKNTKNWLKITFFCDFWNFWPLKNTYFDQFWPKNNKISLYCKRFCIFTKPILSKKNGIFNEIVVIDE